MGGVIFWGSVKAFMNGSLEMMMELFYHGKWDQHGMEFGDTTTFRLIPEGSLKERLRMQV